MPTPAPASPPNREREPTLLDSLPDEWRKVETHGFWRKPDPKDLHFPLNLLQDDVAGDVIREQKIIWSNKRSAELAREWDAMGATHAQLLPQTAHYIRTVAGFGTGAVTITGKERNKTVDRAVASLQRAVLDKAERFDPFETARLIALQAAYIVICAHNGTVSPDIAQPMVHTAMTLLVNGQQAQVDEETAVDMMRIRSEGHKESKPYHAMRQTFVELLLAVGVQNEEIHHAIINTMGNMMASDLAVNNHDNKTGTFRYTPSIRAEVGRYLGYLRAADMALGRMQTPEQILQSKGWAQEPITNEIKEYRKAMGVLADQGIDPNNKATYKDKKLTDEARKSLDVVQTQEMVRHLFGMLIEENPFAAEILGQVIAEPGLLKVLRKSNTRTPVALGVGPLTAWTLSGRVGLQNATVYMPGPELNEIRDQLAPASKAMQDIIDDWFRNHPLHHGPKALRNALEHKKFYPYMAREARIRLELFPIEYIEKAKKQQAELALKIASEAHLLAAESDPELEKAFKTWAGDPSNIRGAIATYVTTKIPESETNYERRRAKEIRRLTKLFTEAKDLQAIQLLLNNQEFFATLKSMRDQEIRKQFGLENTTITQVGGAQYISEDVTNLTILAFSSEVGSEPDFLRSFAMATLCAKLAYSADVFTEISPEATEANARLILPYLVNEIKKTIDENHPFGNQDAYVWKILQAFMPLWSPETRIQMLECYRTALCVDERLMENWSLLCRIAAFKSLEHPDQPLIDDRIAPAIVEMTKGLLANYWSMGGVTPRIERSMIVNFASFINEKPNGQLEVTGDPKVAIKSKFHRNAVDTLGLFGAKYGLQQFSEVVEEAAQRELRMIINASNPLVDQSIQIIDGATKIRLRHQEELIAALQDQLSIVETVYKEFLGTSGVRQSDITKLLRDTLKPFRNFLRYGGSENADPSNVLFKYPEVLSHIETIQQSIARPNLPERQTSA